MNARATTLDEAAAWCAEMSARKAIARDSRLGVAGLSHAVAAGAYAKAARHFHNLAAQERAQHQTEAAAP